MGKNGLITLNEPLAEPKRSRATTLEELGELGDTIKQHTVIK